MRRAVLSEPGEGTEDPFVTDILFGPYAKLLMPDLVAHKAYRERRQYRLGSEEPKVRTLIDKLRCASYSVFAATSRAAARPGDLERVTRSEGPLLRETTNLDRLRISIARQIYNFDRWTPTSDGTNAVLKGKSGLPNLFMFHREQMNTSHYELEQLISEARNELDSARSAVGAVRARLAQQYTRQQERVQRWLAVVAAALAVPQLVDQQGAKVLLDFLHVATPVGGYSDNTVFWARAAVTLVGAVAIGAIVSLVGWVRGRMRD